MQLLTIQILLIFFFLKLFSLTFAVALFVDIELFVFIEYLFDKNQ